MISADLEEVKSCDICIAAKQGKSPHIVESESTPDCIEKMDWIHIDLVGPIATISMHVGFKSFQFRMEVSTRLSVVSLLKKKYEALTLSRVVIPHLESESGRKLKSPRIRGECVKIVRVQNKICEIPGGLLEHVSHLIFS